MCGIAGEINFSKKIDYKEYHNQMLLSLKHRGPNDDGKYCFENGVLLHARLGVRDPKNNVQPRYEKFENNEYVICYNGELYNTDEIKTELTRMGVAFETNGDTEVVLKAYIHFGVDAVNLFNGIFAFVIYDRTANRVLIARDKMGVKPFFYAIRDNSFIFASEIKALLTHPKIEPVVDINGISELLFIGPGRTEGSGVFKDIYELKSGHLGYFSKDGLKIEKYFSLKDKQNNESAEQIIENVRFLVTDAIKRQLVSDVPLGTFLSGGLDSSIISAVANEHYKECGLKLQTFSLHYKDNNKYFKSSKFQPNSDDEFIKIMVDYLKSEHHSIVLDTDDIVNALYLAVDARDLPGMADVDSSLLAFCKEIKKHVTVALSGECADEIFGGYPWYRDKDIREKYGFPWAQSNEYRKSFVKADILEKINPDKYVSDRYEQSIKEASKAKGLSPLESRMREMVYLNTHWFMQTLLDRKDRMSMYNALEVRVPFCDSRIAEYMYSVPWEIKDFGGREKGLLRKAMEGVLPDSILWRKKSPYPKTHNPAYFEAVKNILGDIISNPNEPIFDFIEKKALLNLMTTERSEPWYGQLMTTPQTVAYFISFNYWLTKFKVKIV